MIVDRDLLDRLDRIAAQLALEMADGYRRVEPHGPAVACAFGSGALVALGPGRWVNRAIGVPPPDDPSSFEKLEGFFVEAGVPPSIEVGTWAAQSELTTLASRGYVAAWFRDVFVAPPRLATTAVPSAVVVRDVDARDANEWTDVFTRAFSAGSAEDAANAERHARAMLKTPSTTHFVATIDDEVVGCASLSLVGGLAWLGGAATLPSQRGRGVQAALLRHRVRLAVDAGCDLAAATAAPTGPSARNLRRTGFTLATAQAVMTQSNRASDGGSEATSVT